MVAGMDSEDHILDQVVHNLVVEDIHLGLLDTVLGIDSAYMAADHKIV